MSLDDVHIGVDARELSGRPTGTGRYLEELLRRWKGWPKRRFTLFTNAPGATLAEWAAAGMTIHEIPAERGSIFEQWHLPRALRSRSVDVLFCPAYTCPLATSVPRVTTIHDLSFFALPDDFSLVEGTRRRLLVSGSIRASKTVLAVSDFTRREIGRLFPDALSKTHTVLHGAPPLRDLGGRPEDGGATILSIGSLFNRRCMPELLAALALLARRGRRFEAVVVGDNRTHPLRNFTAMADDLRLGERVRFLGYVGEAEREQLLRRATLAVYLSRYEGFGLPALEALAAGLPLVAAARPALVELFDDAAEWVDPDDPHAIAAGVDALLGDGGRRAELRRRGRIVAERFSWETAARETMAHIEGAAP